MSHTISKSRLVREDVEQSLSRKLRVLAASIALRSAALIAVAGCTSHPEGSAPDERVEAYARVMALLRETSALSEAEKARSTEGNVSMKLAELIDRVRRRANIPVIVQWGNINLAIERDDVIEIDLRKSSTADLLDAALKEGYFFVGYEITPTLVVSDRSLLPERPAGLVTTALNDRGKELYAVRQVEFRTDPNTASGYYVPIDLEDCLRELRRVFRPEMVNLIRASADINEFHDMYGGLIRERWGLASDSQLSTFFKKLGMNSPEGMSTIILRSFWRQLNQSPLDLLEQIASYEDLNRTVSTPPS
ncbi:MAG: hypothetical protein GDA68_20170 [Nitrospira sp. CR2.1]|nr:hypothetical protein [Nitrospira sp. CR2.1]